MTLPSLNLLLQSILSGIFIGGLYGLIGLGLGLTWGLLRQINLSHFGLVFLAAYLSYQMAMVWQVDPLLTLVILPPLFFVVGVGMQWVLSRFSISPFNSLLVTFGITVVIESAIQGIWTADFRKLESHYNDLKFTVGSLYVPVPELVTLVLAVAISLRHLGRDALHRPGQGAAGHGRGRADRRRLRHQPEAPVADPGRRAARRWPRSPASAWRSPSRSRRRRSLPGSAWCSRR